jgi:hypothetical protein
VRRLALIPTVVLFLLAAALPATGNSAERSGEDLISVTDKKNDVHFFVHAEGATPAERRSIDIRRLRVQQRPDAVRFIIKLKQITATQKFDQIAVLLLNQRGKTATDVSGEIGFSAQDRLVDSYAHIIDGNFDVVAACEPLNPQAKPKKGEFRVDVPLECIPPGKLRISLGMVAGEGYAGEGKTLYSRDALKIFKPYVLHP